jgi:carbon-monoxide dehydrogenase medium subunit
MIGVFVADTAGGVRAAVTGAGSGVFRAKDVEAALAKGFSSASLNGVKVSAHDVAGDLHASAEYRAHLITVMAKRAVDAAK